MFSGAWPGCAINTEMTSVIKDNINSLRITYKTKPNKYPSRAYLPPVFRINGQNNVDEKSLL